jgi:hypothetical protein
MYYSIAYDTYVESKPTRARILFTLADLLVITPLLSWLFILYNLWFWLASYFNMIASPEKLKELQFNISSMDLPKEKVEELLCDFQRHYGLYNLLASIDEEDDEKNVLIIENGGMEDYSAELRVSPSIMQYSHNYHAPYYDYATDETYEYKIEGTRVFSRLISRRVHGLFVDGQEHYEFKDGVLLESHIRRRLNDTKSRLDKETPDETISHMRKELEWNEISSIIAYFLLSKHPRIISRQEFRKHIRQELERMKLGIMKIREFANLNGLEIRQGKNNQYEIHFPETVSEEQGKQLGEIYRLNMNEHTYSNFGVYQGEFSDNDNLQNTLLEYLGEKKENGSRKSS